MTTRWTRSALHSWDRDTPAESISPEAAFEQSLPVPWWLRSYFVDRCGRQPDEVRTYYASAMRPGGPFQAIFVVRGGLVRDVHNLADVDHRAAQAAFAQIRGF